MQVYSAFMKIAKKQKQQVFVYLGIFILLTMFMTNAMSGQKKEYVDTKCIISIFDYDNSEESKHLAEYLSSIHELKELEDDESVILDTMYLMNVDYVLYINKGYSEDGKLTSIKRPGTTMGNYVDNQIMTYENSIKALVTSGYSYDEAYAKTIDSLKSDGLVSMLENKSSSKPASYYAFVFTPYIASMLLFNILGPVLVAYNRKEVRDRAIVSSMDSKSQTSQLILAALTLSAIVWALFVVVGLIYGGGDAYSGVKAVNLLNIFLCTLVASSFVTIFGNFEMKAQSLSMVSNIYGLGTSFLGGVFVTIEIFGDGMRTLARFMPSYWYVRVLDKTYVGESDGIAEALLMQLLFAAIFFVINIIVIRKKRMGRA